MSRIIDDRNKAYGKKTISKYDKETILIVLKKMIMANDFESSLYFATELHASGNFDELWNVIFDIILDQVHILNFKLPVFICIKYQRFDYFVKQFKSGQKIEIRNVGEMREDLFHIIYILTYSPKEDLSRYIPKSYYSVNEDSYDILGNVFSEKYVPEMSILREVTDARSNDIDKAIHNFKKSLIRVIKDSALYDRMREKETLFFWLSRIISNSFQSSNIVGYPNNVSLYTGYNENDYKQFIMKLWNIILLGSKINKYIFHQIGALYKLFIFCSKKKKYDITFLNRFLITAILYITDRPKADNVILEKLFDKVNHKPIHRLYANIKDALKNGTQRVDYIEVKRKVDKYKNVKNAKKRNRLRKRRKQKLMDERLQINPIFEEREIELNEKKEDLLNNKIEQKFDIVELNNLPNIQNKEQRERDIEIIDIEQREKDRLEQLMKQGKFKTEIMAERDELFDKEINESDNNFNKVELLYFKDDTLPNMFRFLTYTEDVEESESELEPPSVLDHLSNNTSRNQEIKSIVTKNIKKKKKRSQYDIYKV